MERLEKELKENSVVAGGVLGNVWELAGGREPLVGSVCSFLQCSYPHIFNL